MMTDRPQSAGPPPGWYADSPTSTRLRWWNGSAWTDHYQAETQPLSITAPPADAAPAVPMTRAERRAAEASALAAHPPASHAEPPPAAPTVNLARPEPIESPPASQPDQAEAPKSVDDDSAQLPAAARLAEAFPDQIMDRTPRMGEYRPPLPPVTYRPPPGTHVASTRTTYVAVEQKNGPAKASLILILISLLGGVAVVWLIGGADPALIGVVNLINGAILLVAFILAVIAVVLSVQRPTKKREPVFALVASSLLIIGTIVVFAVRVLASGFVVGAG